MMRSTHRALAAACRLWLGLACLLAAGPARADLVRGFVRDLQGNPIFNADFNVYDYATENKLLASDKTDVTGAYKLVLDPGVYNLLCQVKDVTRGFASQMKRGVIVNGEIHLDYVLPPSVQVRGRVLKAQSDNPDSFAVYPCNLDFDRTDDGLRQPSIGNATSPFGTFIDYIEAASYTVTANPADTTLAPARVYDWSVPTSNILQITCQRAVHLAATIHDSRGNPVEGAIFRFDDTTGVRHPTTRHLSDATGFLRDAVEPGIYRVTVEPKAGGHDAAIRVQGVDMTSSRSMDFTLPVGAAVSGRVTDKLGNPIPHANWLVAEAETGAGAATPGDNTDLDGNYRWVVAPGVYRLKLGFPAATGLDTLYFENVPIARDTTIDVDFAALGGGGGGGSPVLRFAPKSNPTHTSASLTLVLGRPVTDALIEVYDVGGRRARVLHSGPLPAGTQQIAWDGRRTSGAQAHTGVYFVRARLDGHDKVTRFVLLP